MFAYCFLILVVELNNYEPETEKLSEFCCVLHNAICLVCLAVGHDTCFPSVTLQREWTLILKIFASGFMPRLNWDIHPHQLFTDRVAFRRSGTRIGTVVQVQEKTFVKWPKSAVSSTAPDYFFCAYIEAISAISGLVRRQL